MGESYGRRTLTTAGRSIQVSADGKPKMKHAGVTVDWATVPAVSGSDATYLDGVTVAVGEKALRYGQVLTQITSTASDTITLDATGGTFTITVTTSAGAQTTGNIAFDATAATVQTAVRGLSNVGGTLATVTGNAGGPYTLTFDDSLGAVTVTADAALLTGSGHTATVAQITPGGDVGKYGPYDPAAADGRQTLTRDKVFIVNETLREDDTASDHSPVLFGGVCFQSRILQSGVGTHSLAAGPTLAELRAVMPQLALVTEAGT